MIEYDGGYFDAGSTLGCGQLFRYDVSGDGYVLYAGSHRAELRTENGKTYIAADDEEYFKKYFDLSADYADVVRFCSGFPELTAAVNASCGIRIVKQEFFETLISFIISANNNIPRIKGIIDRLCEAYGEQMDGYHAFPTPERLKDVSEDDYRALGTGYRCSYLAATVKKTLETDICSLISKADTSEAGKLLCGFKGVGRKVADCVLLFGLGRTDVFPVDTWIFKIFGNEQLNTPDKVREYCLSRYGRYAGYAQQYAYHFGRNF